MVACGRAPGTPRRFDPASRALRREGEDRHRGARAAECPVKIERMDIVVIGGHEHLPYPPRRRLRPQFGHQPSSDPLALMLPAHGNIVDEEFGRLRARQGYGMGGHAPNQLILSDSRERPKRLLAEELSQIAIAQRVVRFAKDVRHEGKQRPRQIAVGHRESHHAHRHPRSLPPWAPRAARPYAWPARQLLRFRHHRATAPARAGRAYVTRTTSWPAPNWALHIRAASQSPSVSHR